jgi:hypothetical protein
MASPALPSQAVLSADCTARAATASTRNPGTGDDRASSEQTIPAGIARSGRHSVSTTGAGLGGLAGVLPKGMRRGRYHAAAASSRNVWPTPAFPFWCGLFSGSEVAPARLPGRATPGGRGSINSLIFKRRNFALVVKGPYSLRILQAIDFERHEMVLAVKVYLPGKYHGVCGILCRPLIFLSERKIALGCAFRRARPRHDEGGGRAAQAGAYLERRRPEGQSRRARHVPRGGAGASESWAIHQP